MDKELILEVKKKKEFSKLPDSLIQKALILSKFDIKETRSLLRKYFGVFLTNKVIKGTGEPILKNHISSKNRDYSNFYKDLLKDTSGFKSVLDIGCGVNGLSYNFLKKELGAINYIGIEAVGQLTDKMNIYFKENGFLNARAICLDIFDSKNIISLIKESPNPRAIFLLQVIDALEGFEKNSSKVLLTSLKENISEKDIIIISMPMKSISGKTKFEAKRGWLRWFLEENFNIEESFIQDERIFRCRKK